MKTLSILASLILLSASATAHAHGGTRQKVVERVEINALPDAVWAIVKNFGDARWMPSVAGSQGQGGNEKGAIRELALKKGGVVKEELKEYDAVNRTLKYRVHEEPDCAVFPVNNYSATLTVAAAGQGSQVEWSSAAYRCFTPNNPPPGQDEKAAIEAMSTLAQESLAELKRLAEQAGGAGSGEAAPTALSASRTALAAGRQDGAASMASTPRSTVARMEDDGTDSGKTVAGILALAIATYAWRAGKPVQG